MPDPFDILPNELIQDVFMIALRDEHLSCRASNSTSTNVLVLLHLSAVCRRWRNLACSSAELWSLIHLSQEAFHFLPLFCERSKSQEIDLTLKFSGPSTAETTKALSSTFTSEISRVRSLELEFYTSAHLMFQFLSTCSTNVATNLTSLKLGCFPTTLSWACDDMNHLSVVKSAQSLQSVVLKGICSQLSPPLVGLTHLEIHAFSPSFLEFRNLFTSNPALSSLCLPEFCSTELSDEEHSFVDASSLRLLSVGLGIHWGLGTCDCMLTILKMENLEYLEIVGNSSGSVRNHFSRKNGLQKVRTLRLRKLEADDASDAPLWNALDAVAHVELDDTNGFAEVLHAPSGEGSIIYFPKLTSLTFLDGEDSIDLPDNLHMVNAICSRAGLTRIEVSSDLRVIPHLDIVAKLKAAGLKLVFIKYTPRLGHYDSDPDFDDTEEIWLEDADYLHELDYLSEFEEEEEEEYFDDGWEDEY